MRARTAIGCARRRTSLGANESRIRSCAGARTLDTGIDTAPPASLIAPATLECESDSPAAVPVAGAGSDGCGVVAGGAATGVVVSAALVVGGCVPVVAVDVVPVARLGRVTVVRPGSVIVGRPSAAAGCGVAETR